MFKIVQNNSETCNFCILRFRKNVGYNPATPGAELCSVWHGSLCRIARLCLKMPLRLVICRLFNNLAGQPNVSVKQLWNRLRSAPDAICTGSYWFIGLIGHITSKFQFCKTSVTILILQYLSAKVLWLALRRGLVTIRRPQVLQ